MKALALRRTQRPVPFNRPGSAAAREQAPRPGTIQPTKGNRMISWIRRRRGERRLADVLRQLDEMSPSDAAAVLRELIGTSQDREVRGELLARIAEKAAEGATGPGRDILLKYANTYRQGRLVKWASATGVLMQEGETPELISEIESSFEGKEMN